MSCRSHFLMSYSSVQYSPNYTLFSFNSCNIKYIFTFHFSSLVALRPLTTTARSRLLWFGVQPIGLCLTVCDLGTSKKITLAVCFAAAAQKECNIKFIYTHWNCIRRLLPAPRKCGYFSRVGFL